MQQLEGMYRHFCDVGLVTPVRHRGCVEHLAERGTIALGSYYISPLGWGKRQLRGILHFFLEMHNIVGDILIYDGKAKVFVRPCGICK